jgi:hypothetical protein
MRKISFLSFEEDPNSPSSKFLRLIAIIKSHFPFIPFKSKQEPKTRDEKLKSRDGAWKISKQIRSSENAPHPHPRLHSHRNIRKTKAKARVERSVDLPDSPVNKRGQNLIPASITA